MTSDEIEVALAEYLGLHLIDGLNYAWFNKTEAPGKPYLTMALNLGPSQDQTLGGGARIDRGSLQLVLVTEEGEGARLSRQILGQIEALFVYPTILTAPTGVIKTSGPPHAPGGFAQAGWRRPITIPFTAT